MKRRKVRNGRNEMPRVQQGGGGGGRSLYNENYAQCCCCTSILPILELLEKGGKKKTICVVNHNLPVAHRPSSKLFKVELR